MTGVLKGIRVLDLSTIVAGPTTSMILADLGADVIKVERPACGEDGRLMGPHRGSWGAYFTALNRGKRSIAIDIRSSAGREAVLRIAATCDVFLENFRGGKSAEFGLDETAVRTQRPDIIYAALSAYGAGGPDYTRPGYDAVLQARTGIMGITGNEGEPPVRVGVSILDMGTGVWTALGIVAALLERRNSGNGQRLDTSLFQTGVTLMSYHLLYRQFSGVNPRPQGSRHTAFAPYGAYNTADGAIMIGISSDQAFKRLCGALGQAEAPIKGASQSCWADDPRFLTNSDRVRDTPELDKGISEILARHNTAWWAGVFGKHDIAFDPVQTADQVMADRQLAALDLLEEVPLPGEASASLPKLPLGFSLTPAAIAGPPRC
jgi:crotonobetainyl-CoA:carnitine CoA-transferase CaiB-like acyl-CoA transferase